MCTLICYLKFKHNQCIHSVTLFYLIQGIVWSIIYLYVSLTFRWFIILTIWSKKYQDNITLRGDIKTTALNYFPDQYARSCLLLIKYQYASTYRRVTTLLDYLWEWQKQLYIFFPSLNKKTIDSIHQRLPLKKFEEDKIDSITVNLCLSILTCYNAITRVNKPSYYTTMLNQFKYNQDDSKIEVHDIKPVLPSTKVLLLNHCKH